MTEWILLGWLGVNVGIALLAFLTRERVPKERGEPRVLDGAQILRRLKIKSQGQAR